MKHSWHLIYAMAFGLVAWVVIAYLFHLVATFKGLQ